jgi:uncharacterized protein YjiS (DUF1127 family)
MTCRPSSAMSKPWRALAGAVTHWRQQASRRAELASVDDRTLRDLGLDRSEWSSALAESSGMAEATRLRLAPRPPAARPASHARLRLASARWVCVAAAWLAPLVLFGLGGR